MTRYAVLVVVAVLGLAYALGQIGAGVVQGWMTATGIGG